MKINREPRPFGDDEAFHVWPSTTEWDSLVGIACGPLFNLIPVSEARELANALYEAAEKSEKAQGKVKTEVA